MPADAHRPKSRHPSSYPPELLRAIAVACKRELCIPFQSIDIARQFRKTLSDIRRSYREHQAPNWAKVNAMTVTEHTTLDVMASRPSYEQDIRQYPITLILSCASGFLENLEIAQTTAEDEGDSHPSRLPPNAMEADTLALLSLLPDEDEDSTETTIHSIFNKRR